jgi:hypothetical protein
MADDRDVILAEGFLFFRVPDRGLEELLGDQGRGSVRLVNASGKAIEHQAASG